MKGKDQVEIVFYLSNLVSIILLAYLGVSTIAFLIYGLYAIILIISLYDGIDKIKKIKCTGKAVDDPEDGDYVIIAWPNVVTLYEKFHRTYWEIRRYDKEKKD